MGEGYVNISLAVGAGLQDTVESSQVKSTSLLQAVYARQTLSGFQIEGVVMTSSVFIGPAMWTCAC